MVDVAVGWAVQGRNLHFQRGSLLGMRCQLFLCARGGCNFQGVEEHCLRRSQDMNNHLRVDSRTHCEFDQIWQHWQVFWLASTAFVVSYLTMRSRKLRAT